MSSTLSGRSVYWREAAKNGFTAIKLAEWGTAAEALDHEAFLIACLRDMGLQLVNRTTGGQNGKVGPITEQTRERMRKAQKRINDRCLVDLEWADRLRSNRGRAGSSPKPPGIQLKAAETFRKRFVEGGEYAVRVRDNRRKAAARSLEVKHAKLEEKVRLVRDMRVLGHSLKEISKATKYSMASVSNILNGKTLKGVGE